MRPCPPAPGSEPSTTRPPARANASVNRCGTPAGSDGNDLCQRSLLLLVQLSPRRMQELRLITGQRQIRCLWRKRKNDISLDEEPHETLRPGAIRIRSQIVFRPSKARPERCSRLSIPSSTASRHVMDGATPVPPPRCAVTVSPRRCASSMIAANASFEMSWIALNEVKPSPAQYRTARRASSGPRTILSSEKFTDDLDPPAIHSFAGEEWAREM